MKKHHGFTLIELMITLLLSSLLIAAIGRVFLDSGNSFRKQQSLSYMIQDGRYAMEMLGKEFRRTGFLRNPYVAGGTALDIFPASINTFGSGITLAAEEPSHGSFNLAGVGGDAFDNNRLLFRYQLDDVNDLGASPDYAASPCTKDIHLNAGEDPDTQKIMVTLYLYVQFDNVTNVPVLYCKAKRENFDAPLNNTTLNPTAIPLVSNVEKWLILYGVNTDAVGLSENQYANHYLRADQVTDWTEVKSVRFYLVIASDDKNVSSGTPSYRIDGRDYTVNSPADKRLYKVLSSTIAFRNNPE